MGGCVTKESALWPCGINKSFWYEILMKMLFDVCVFDIMWWNTVFAQLDAAATHCAILCGF